MTVHFVPPFVVRILCAFFPAEAKSTAFKCWIKQKICVCDYGSVKCTGREKKTTSSLFQETLPVSYTTTGREGNDCVDKGSQEDCLNP